MSEAADNIPLARTAVIAYAGGHHTQVQALRPQSPAVALAFAIAWSFGGAVALAAVAGVAWLLAEKVFVAVSPFLGLLFLIAIGMFFRGLRRGRAVAALNYVEQAVRLNLPLPPMLEAAEQGETGRLGTKLRKLRQKLEDGAAIGAAMDQTLPGLPARAIGLIAAAERNGSLAATLGRLVRELRRKPQAHGDPSRAILLRWYPLVLLLGLSSTLGMFAVFVMPKYEQIFRDFDVNLPKITIYTTHVWGWVGPPLGLLMVAVALVLSGQMLAEALAPRSAWRDRGPQAGPAQLLLDWVGWWLPLSRSVVRSRGLADVCHVLADAAAAGRPADAALHDAARLRINTVLRRQVTHWASQIVAGVPLAEAARRAGMPPLVSGMLAPVSTPGKGSADVQEVFAFLARYYDGRFSRSAALLEGAAVPAMVMLFGFFVASAALGLMLPMMELIDRTGQLTGMN